MLAENVLHNVQFWLLIAYLTLFFYRQQNFYLTQQMVNRERSQIQNPRDEPSRWPNKGIQRSAEKERGKES